MPESFWTPERMATTRAAWAAGQSLREIATRLGTTRGAVAGKVHRMDLPPRAGSAKEWVELVLAGETEMVPKMREGTAYAAGWNAAIDCFIAALRHHSAAGGQS